MDHSLWNTAYWFYFETEKRIHNWKILKNRVSVVVKLFQDLFIRLLRCLRCYGATCHTLVNVSWEIVEHQNTVGTQERINRVRFIRLQNAAQWCVILTVTGCYNCTNATAITFHILQSRAALCSRVKYGNTVVVYYLGNSCVLSQLIRLVRRFWLFFLIRSPVQALKSDIGLMKRGGLDPAQTELWFDSYLVWKHFRLSDQIQVVKAGKGKISDCSTFGED